ncbi:MAG TPA: phenylacetate--CoA ligase family protein, partial [Rhizobacter sp.]
VAQLNTLMPTIIATYPSAAVLLAEERQAGRLAVRPNEVWTGGESLTPAMRRHVEQVFGCSVVDNYGASEFLALASPCRCGHLHLNSDWALLESVDASGRRVPDGQLGATALLTNLANPVQPLIRYDLGDRIAVRPGRCACGSPFPAIEVHGRHDDTLHLRVGGRTVGLMPLALCTVLEEEAGLFDFQVVQRGPASLEILIGVGVAPPRAVCERALQAVGAYLARLGAGRVRLSCHRARETPRGPGGKVQRVVSLKEG